MHYNDLTTPDPKAIIIAEAGINHDGDIEKALRMIDVAAEVALTEIPELSGTETCDPRCAYQLLYQGRQQRR